MDTHIIYLPVVEDFLGDLHPDFKLILTQKDFSYCMKQTSTSETVRQIVIGFLKQFTESFL